MQKPARTRNPPPRPPSCWCSPPTKPSHNLTPPPRPPSCWCSPPTKTLPQPHPPAPPPQLLVLASRLEVQGVVRLTTNSDFCGLWFVAHAYDVLRAYPRADALLARPLPHLGCDQVGPGDGVAWVGWEGRGGVVGGKLGVTGGWGVGGVTRLDTTHANHTKAALKPPQSRPKPSKQTAQTKPSQNRPYQPPPGGDVHPPLRRDPHGWGRHLAGRRHCLH